MRHGNGFALNWLLVIGGLSVAAHADETLVKLRVGPDVRFDERDGVIALEAEHFVRQNRTVSRAWHITSSQAAPEVEPDGDPAHVAGASGGAYLESLPDTRRTHDDKLINGENFSPEPGKLAVLHYPIRVRTAGRYYVWVRAYSTGGEDNGLHIGLDDLWPASGQRWQTVAKNGWHWDCTQRTAEVHTGVPMQLFLDIDRPGDHELLVSMREDGFEFDKLVLAKSMEFRPQGLGPDVCVVNVQRPEPFPFIAAAEQSSAGVDQPNPAAKSAIPPLVEPRQPDGAGGATITGELKQWHKITLTLDGPFAHELDNAPNPFTDTNLTVTFTHESGTPSYQVPGYFAVDGNAGESSAVAGTKWRSHLAPDKAGTWSYVVSFTQGRHAALVGGGQRLKPFDGVTGRFTIAPTDKSGRDFRARGRLRYVGMHHLQFSGSKEFFLKAGPDAPETLLAYADFDGTEPGRKRDARTGEAAAAQPLHRYEPHLGDWKEGHPAWQGGKGKGLIGALNYLASKGCNSFSFLPYNAAGDGDNIWPFVSRDDKLHYDCSKLDQWCVVFDHATALGLHLHFKLQENEMDDNRRGHEAAVGKVLESLDGGQLGIERKLYCRELIARFGHALALNWNLGEENTQSAEEQRDMIRYLYDTDPYKHNIVIHTFPDQQDKVYFELLGDKSLLTGASLQNSWSNAHQRTLKWVTESARAKRPWVVCNDEQGPASLGVPPDPGYKGHDGVAKVSVDPKAKQDTKKNAKPPSPDETRGYTLHDIRKLCLWGTLMAGGAGVEYYFGYQLPQNDLVCEDFRSRDRSWEYCRIALNFFRDEKIPFERMTCADGLVGNSKNDNSRYCFAIPGEVYLVYLPSGGGTDLDLNHAKGTGLTVKWFNPRTGGALQDGSVTRVVGPGRVSLGQPPTDAQEDWAVLVRR